MVSSELGINTLQRRILVGLGLSDTVSVSLRVLVVVGVVLGLRHFCAVSIWEQKKRGKWRGERQQVKIEIRR